MNHYSRLSQIDFPKSNLIEEIWGRIKPVEKGDRTIANIMRMIHTNLDASAASLLLIDENTRELYFRYANGPVGRQVKRLHIDKRSGIAGWIARNGKPLIVNDPGKNQHFYENIDKATGFKTKSIIGVPIIIDGEVTGVIEALNKQDGTNFNRNDLKLMQSLASAAAMVLKNKGMQNELMNAYKGTVKALVSLADTKETSGGGHSRRVMEYAIMGAHEIPLPKEEVETLEYAALLHDIGKLSLPDDILNKSESLTDEEWQMVRTHPVVGYNLLKDVPFIKDASKFILYHHEKYNGKGYPDGLKGQSIPLSARLIAVADAFDHMTTPHSYRKAITRQQAFVELHREEGTHFCPIALNAFKSGFIKSQLIPTKRNTI